MTHLIHQPHARETAAEWARERAETVKLTRQLARRHAERLSRADRRRGAKRELRS